MKLNLFIRYFLPHLACPERINNNRLLYSDGKYSIFITNIFKDTTWISRTQDIDYQYSLSIVNNSDIGTKEKYVKCLKFKYSMELQDYDFYKCTRRNIPDHILKIFEDFKILYPNRIVLNEKIKDLITIEFS